MLADYNNLQRGVSVLSYARSEIHTICNKIECAINEAKSKNKSPKFSKCCRQVEESTKKMRKTTDDLVRIGQALQALAEVVAKFEG